MFITLVLVPRMLNLRNLDVEQRQHHLPPNANSETVYHLLKKKKKTLPLCACVCLRVVVQRTLSSPSRLCGEAERKRKHK